MSTASNLGKWAPWWRDAEPSPLGPEDSYVLGAAWLRGLRTSDWGCGTGWSRRYFPDDLWTGVDGTGGARQKVIIADLATYREPSEGIFMRHVLKHNEDWRTVLANALQSFQKRMFLAIFTAPVPTTRVFNRVAELGGVVEIEFNFDDIDDVIAAHPDVEYAKALLPPRGPFLAESVWFLSKEPR